MAPKFATFNSFSNIVGKGNPAAIVWQPNWKHCDVASSMQKYAKEFNLSETAFVARLAANKYSIRYFTPTDEIALCGHATLAAAQMINTELNLPAITFVTFMESVELTCLMRDGKVEMR